MNKLDILNSTKTSVIFKGNEYVYVGTENNKIMITNNLSEFLKKKSLGETYRTIDFSEIEEIYDYEFFCIYKNLEIRLTYIRKEENKVRIEIQEDDELYGESEYFLQTVLGMEFFQPDYEYSKIVKPEEISNITYKATPRFQKNKKQNENIETWNRNTETKHMGRLMRK